MSVLLLAQLVQCQSPNPHISGQIRKEMILKYTLVKRLFCTTCKIDIHEPEKRTSRSWFFIQSCWTPNKIHPSKLKGKRINTHGYHGYYGNDRSNCVWRNIHLQPLTFELASIVSIHPCFMPFHRLIVGLLRPTCSELGTIQCVSISMQIFRAFLNGILESSKATWKHLCLFVSQCHFVSIWVVPHVLHFPLKVYPKLLSWGCHFPFSIPISALTHGRPLP